MKPWPQCEQLWPDERQGHIMATAVIILELPWTHSHEDHPKCWYLYSNLQDVMLCSRRLTVLCIQRFEPQVWRDCEQLPYFVNGDPITLFFSFAACRNWLAYATWVAQQSARQLSLKWNLHFVQHSTVMCSLHRYRFYCIALNWAFFKLTHWGRLGSFKLFKRPFPGFLTILTL